MSRWRVNRSADRQLVAGRYALGPPLRQDDVGVVRQGEDTQLGRPVLVEELVLPEKTGDTGQDAVRDRLLQAARAVARVDHAGVVQLYDVVNDGSRVLLVTEQLDASPLERIVTQEGALGVEEVANLGGQLLLALDAAHRRGVIHGDVRPSNVLVLRDGRVKIGGFALLHDGEAEPAVRRERDLRALGATLRYAAKGRWAAGDDIDGSGDPDREPAAALQAAVMLLLTGAVDQDEVLNTVLRHLSAAARTDSSPNVAAAGTDQTANDLPTTVDPGAPPAAAAHGTIPPAGTAAARQASPARPAGTQMPGPEVSSPAPAPAPAPPTLPGTAAADQRPPDQVPTGIEPGQEQQSNAPQELPAVPPTRPGQRRQLLAGLTTVGVIVAIVTLTIVLVSGGSRPETDRSGSPDGRQAVAGADGIQRVTGTRPDGWQEYLDPEHGHVIAVPSTWEPVQDRAQRVVFQDPATGAFVRVDREPRPGGPLEQEPLRLEDRYQGRNYQRLRLESTSFKGLPAAVWEFTYQDGSTTMHVEELRFIVNDAAYVISFQVPETSWTATERQREQIHGSFGVDIDRVTPGTP